jgi:CRP-like cAMP-binding protein
MELTWLAAFWGGLSAVSLPLGAILGLWLRPSRVVSSALMAFGAGALLFALTIELFGHALHVASDGHGHVTRPGILAVAMAAALAGGLLFNGLNRLLESKGAFLRKGALLKKHVVRAKRREARHQLRSLSRVPLIHALPIEEVIRLLAEVEAVRFEPGEVIFAEGDEGDGLYIIETGEVSVERGGKEVPGAGHGIASLGSGDVLGEMALVAKRPRSATAMARTAVRAWLVPREAFDRNRASSPGFGGAVEDLARSRIRDLGQRGEVAAEEAERWAREASAALNRLALPTPLGHRSTGRDHGNAAVAIWLGIALDGIPESLVIGMLVVTAAAAGDTLSLAFVVGVFLANLPEAMSSAVTMRRGGMPTARILLMWTSLCVLTAVGAAAGALLLPPASQGSASYAIYAMEGLAGGAMLTMIAETMLPEAFEQGGGPVAGLSTLLGFLAALSIKLIH